MNKVYKNLINMADKAYGRADSAMDDILQQMYKDGLDERFGIQQMVGDGFVIFDEAAVEEYGAAPSVWLVSEAIHSLNELGYFDGRGGI